MGIWGSTAYRLLPDEIASEVRNSPDFLHIRIVNYLQAPDEEYRRLEQAFLGH